MGTFLFVGEQRGFTLVETVVAVAIVALLTFGIVTLSLALRPAALRATIGSFDASFAAARAIAATSGNGATIVVLPRSDASGSRLPGFTLRLYRGRPTAANGVTLADAPAVIADADVREATLGTPPFAIFLSTAGNASGQAAYPAIASDGTPRFATIAKQPACPAGGLVLTFSSVHASQTRVLPCGARAFGSPMPLATESPAPVLLTPKALVFHWPTAPAQSFVATEWGYTRWFAATAFACGANVAQFPRTDPAPPYSPAHSPDDASAAPIAPFGVPVSYADAPDSMQDAPAVFPIAPETAGLCTATIADAFGQKTEIGVEVMGQLTPSQSTLSWSSTDSSPKRIALGKTYDAEALHPRLTDAACAGIVTVRSSGTPLVPTDPTEAASAQAIIVTPVTDAAGNNVGGACTLTYASQYAGEPPAHIAVNVTTGLAEQTWPAQVQYAVQGQTFSVDGETCSAQALTADGSGDAGPPDWVQTLIAASPGMSAVDRDGCYGGAIFFREPSGLSRTISFFATSCDNSVLRAVGLSENPASLAVLTMAAQSTPGKCSITLDDGSGGMKSFYNGRIDAKVVQASNWIAIWHIDYQDACDLQVGDCRGSHDDGTVACLGPQPDAGGYENGMITLGSIASAAGELSYLYNDASYTAATKVPTGYSYHASSPNLHDDWQITLEVWSCYDASNATQPTELR